MTAYLRDNLKNVIIGGPGLVLKVFLNPNRENPMEAMNKNRTNSQKDCAVCLIVVMDIL